MYITTIIHDMDISRLIVHDQQIKEEKLKGKSKDAKTAKSGEGNFSHSRSNGHDHS